MDKGERKEKLAAALGWEYTVNHVENVGNMPDGDLDFGPGWFDADGTFIGKKWIDERGFTDPDIERCIRQRVRELAKPNMVHYHYSPKTDEHVVHISDDVTMGYFYVGSWEDAEGKAWEETLLGLVERPISKI